MPLYTFKCQKCHHTQDAVRSIAERKNGPLCETCGGKTEQIIVPTQIAPIIGGGNFPGYQCPVSGEFVTSRKRRNEIIKEHGLIEKG